MKQIERTREFINELADIEELIFDNAQGLNRGDTPLWEAKRQIKGLERNCKLTKLDPSFLNENPYIKNIHTDEWLVGNIYLSNLSCYEEYKTYIYDMRVRDPKSLTTIYNLCYFGQDMRFPTLGTIFPETKWMGVEPSEIKSFEPFIKEAHGNVLLMGCGLGYVAYMLSIKDNVDSVTIVELDPFVKGMFETYLKPQMNSKISIVAGDALEFLDVEDLSKYDYCSVDIWHGAMEMFPIYIKCLLLEPKHKGTKFHYWLEEDLHCVLETIWIILLKRKFNDAKINKELKIFLDIMNSYNIETVEDIKSFLTVPKRELITEWALNNPDAARNQTNLAPLIEKVLR